MVVVVVVVVVVAVVAAAVAAVVVAAIVAAGQGSIRSHMSKGECIGLGWVVRSKMPMVE